MSDKAKIGAGLAIFVLLAAFPIWYPLVFGGAVSLPEREPPRDGSHCIEANMVARHMDLLNRWQNAVVRGEGGPQYYQSEDYPGERYEMSLTKTCLKCHGIESRTGGTISCSECHTYANVELRCWDCHLDAKGN